VGVAKTIEDAIFEIEEKKPDIVFFDVNIKELEIFPIIEKLNFRNFQIIFATSDESNVFRALQYSPADFLIKPLSPEIVVQAVYKATRRISEKHFLENSKSSEVLRPIRPALHQFLQLIKLKLIRQRKLYFVKRDGILTLSYHTESE
jgi:two-component system LytT family response regulator